MAHIAFHGRLQSIDKGTLDNIHTTYNLACNSNFRIDSELLIYKDRKISKAIEHKNELAFLGKLDGIVIGIGGCDPPNIDLAEKIPEEWKTAAEKFFSSADNPLTYFQRMTIIEKLVTNLKIPLQKAHVIPKFPHVYYPTVVNQFEKIADFKGQYIGVENNHHLSRIYEKGPSGRNLLVFFHDFRDTNLLDERKKPVNFDITEIDEKIFNLYLKRFIIQTDGGFGKEVEQSLDIMFEDSQKHDRDSVLAIACYPKQSDRNEAAQKWKKPYETVMKATAYETYMLVKEYIIKKGVDLTKTHITFLPPDLLSRKLPSRSESYLPKKFVFFTEYAPNDSTITNKNNRIQAHPFCIETKYTNIQ